jgi:hypothetical protein
MPDALADLIRDNDDRATARLARHNRERRWPGVTVTRGSAR